MNERENDEQALDDSVQSERARSPLKWFVLFTFLFLSMSNAMAWLIFAPIPIQTATYYGITVNQVDIFSIVFMIVGVPVGIFGIYIIDKIGLKWSMWVAVTCNTIGTGIRLGTMFHDGSNIENCPDSPGPIMANENVDWLCAAPAWCYPVAIVGTAVAAIGQPFMLVLPTKLAAQWFYPAERDIANSIAALANPLGIMVASILAPIIVNDPPDLKYLQIYFAIPVLLSFITSLFIRQEGYHIDDKEDSFKTRLTLLFKSDKTKNYLFIGCLLMYGIAQFSTVITLMVQFLCTFGYDNTFASCICVSILIGTGIATSLVISLLVQDTRRHVVALKIVIGVALLGITGFNIAMRYPDNEIAIGITIAVYGGAGLAALPLMNELIVETTYPVGEATSTGVSMMASQLVAALLVALSAVVPSSGSDDFPDTVCRDGESQDLTWYLLFVNGVFILYYPFFVYFYSCPYLRHQASRNNSAVTVETENTPVQSNRDDLTHM